MQKKKNLDTDLMLFTEINSKWITDLKVKCKTIRLLEDDLGENLDNLGYGYDFLDTTKKAGSMTEIFGKLDFIKIKNFGSEKGNV